MRPRQCRWSSAGLVCALVAAPLAAGIVSATGGDPDDTQGASEQAEASALGQCANAAANWWNGRSRIQFDDIDPAKAIPLCETATREPSAADAWAFLARAHARAGQYQEMWKAIEQSVAAGSATGLWFRGVAHNSGWGVPEDPYKARPDWEAAAERGDPDAQLELGLWHINGIPNDPELGERLLRQAAGAGLARAQARLGLLLYWDGHHDEALRWLELAAKQRDFDAFYQLGRHYAEGVVGGRDVKRALTYFASALQTGNPEFREEVFNQIVPLTDQYRFFVDLRRDQNPNVRRAAIVGLYQLRDRRAFQAIAELLSDPVGSVRSEAATFFGHLSFLDEARALQLLTPLLRDPDGAAREAAATALSALGPSGARAVLEAVGTGEMPLATAQSLVRPGRNDPRVIDALLSGLNDSDPRHRTSAIQGLREAADERGVQPIIGRLGDADANVRRQAVVALASLGDRRAMDGLLAALVDSNTGVRQAAVEALGDLGDGRAVSPIVDLLGDEGVRDVAINALGRLRDGRAVEPLVGLLNDRVVSDDVAEALGLIGDARAVPALMEALRSSFEADVRREAYWDALVRFGGSQMLSSAFALLQADPTHWTWARFSLARSRDPEVARRLVPLLSAPTASVRASAAYALGRTAFEEYVAIDRGPTVRALIGLLADQDVEVRRAAAEALGEFGDASAVEPLVERLRDPAWIVRADATQSLGRLGDARAVVPVADLLGAVTRLDEVARSGTSATDIRAAIALGQLRDRRATRALVAAANDESGTLRAIVAKALGEIGDPAGLPTLEQLAKDREPVASAASEALKQLGGEHPSGTPADDQISLDVTPFIEHFSIASDAAVLRAVTTVWTDWQGPGAPEGLVEQARGVVARAEAGEFGDSLGALVYLIGSRLAASAEDWPRALQYADRGLVVVPERQIAQRVALSWLRAEALWRRNNAAEALAVLDGIQRELLPQVNAKERGETMLAFATYTSVLRAGVLLALGRPEDARQAVDAADRALQLEGPGHLPYAIEIEQRKLIAAFRLSAKTALGLSLLNEAAAEGPRVRQMFAAAPAASPLQADAERLALEAEIKANLARWGVNSSRLALETAQWLTEQLQLKSQRAPGGVTPGDANRRAAADQLVANRAQLARLDHQIGEAAGDREKLSELRRARDATQRKVQEFIVSLKREHPEVAAYLGAEPAELRTLQPRLEPSTRVVQYLLLDDQGWAFVMSRDDIQVVQLPAGRRELTRLVDGFRTYLDSGESRRQPRASPNAAGQRSESVASARVTAIPNPAGELAGVLLDLLADRLVGVTSLVIVPNGPLHRLPFAALPWRDGYLIEAFDIRVLPSASSIAVVDRPAEQQGAVVLGNPTPPSNEWAPLPAAELEAADVAAIYGTQAVVGSDARRSALVGQDLSGRLLHLALHAQAGTQDTTRLVLSDGYVTVNEVWGLSLEGSPLVVLSACQTALGEQLSGDDVVSLAKGFLFAGSRAVISTLWSVQDDSTREVMTSFHRRRSEGIARALATAQRDLIDRGYGPYHWAAFVLNGW